MHFSYLHQPALSNSLRLVCPILFCCSFASRRMCSGKRLCRPTAHQPCSAPIRLPNAYSVIQRQHGARMQARSSDRRHRAPCRRCACSWMDRYSACGRSSQTSSSRHSPSRPAATSSRTPTIPRCEKSCAGFGVSQRKWI